MVERQLGAAVPRRATVGSFWQVHHYAFHSGWLGCGQAMEMLHIYAELTAAGAPVEERYPGIAAHLRACGPCSEDLEGLLAALRDEAR